jgi:hypothetical protein
LLCPLQYIHTKPLFSYSKDISHSPATITIKINYDCNNTENSI